MIVARFRSWSHGRAFVVPAAVVLALAACSPDPVSEASRSAEESPSPSASLGASDGAPPTESAAAPTGWERVLTFVDENTANSSEVAREVVHGAAGFLAITESFLFGEGGPFLTQRSLWLSADGTTWEEVGFPVAIEDAFLMGVTTTADGDYVLILSIATDGGLASRTEALRSADGRSWEPFESGLPDNLGVIVIEHGAQGWLLAGSRFGGEVEDPGAWYSSDGVTWELVAELSKPNRWVRVSDAAAGDEGFVIVGTDAALEGPGHEWFALASADGREWIESRPLFEPTDANYQPDPHAGALGLSWIAVLPLQDGSMQFWASDDGLEWAESSVLPAPGPLEAYDPVFAEVGGRLYFSIAGGGALHRTTGAWSSSDGTSWEPLDLGVDAHLGGIVAGADIVVLTGTELTDQGNLASIWVGGSD